MQLYDRLKKALQGDGGEALVVEIEREAADKADFVAIADHLAATVPDARRETIAGAGHLPSLEQPAAFDAAVLPFVEGKATA